MRRRESRTASRAESTVGWQRDHSRVEEELGSEPNSAAGSAEARSDCGHIGATRGVREQLSFSLHARQKQDAIESKTAELHDNSRGKKGRKIKRRSGRRKGKKEAVAPDE